MRLQVVVLALQGLNGGLASGHEAGLTQTPGASLRPCPPSLCPMFLNPLTLQRSLDPRFARSAGGEQEGRSAT